MDSIDGLGLTFDDLGPEGKLKALFRLLKSRALSEEERAVIVNSLDNAKNLSDSSQAKLRSAITKEKK